MYSKKKLYYGIDVGGTKIEISVYDFLVGKETSVLWSRREPTPTDNYNQFLSLIVEMVTSTDAKFGTIGTIGIGIPGGENSKDGKVLLANIPCASGRTMRRDLEQRLNGREVLIENDANCFALSEALDPALIDCSAVLGLIVGTGVGGCLVVNGKVMRGMNNFAGEVGHVSLSHSVMERLRWGTSLPPPLFKCGCRMNRVGCVETILSGRGFARLYAYYYGSANDRIKAINNGPLSVETVELLERSSLGDPLALEHLDRYLDAFSIWLGDILTVLDPECVVIGGGFSKFKGLYAELTKRLPKCIIGTARVPKIIAAKYGDAGGTRGAALLHYDVSKRSGKL